MSSGDFLKQIILIGLLIFISTGLSLFDKESRFHNYRERRSSSDDFQASVGTVQTPGGGMAEEVVEPPPPFIETQALPDYLPVRDWSVPDPEISAVGAILFRPQDDKIFYGKNIYEPFPIASLTKLMTALVVTESLPLDDSIVVSRKAVLTEGEAGGLVVGEELTVESLLYVLLVASSNDAAGALEEHFNARFPDRPLVETMNKRALELGLSHATLRNPSGLDEEGAPGNYASPIDLAVFMRYILETNPLIIKITRTQAIDIESLDGRHNHHLVNSNKLLGAVPEVVGGKTGYTEKAGESLLVFFVSPSGDSEEVLVSVVLGSKNREGDTKTLLSWAREAYRW